MTLEEALYAVSVLRTPLGGYTPSEDNAAVLEARTELVAEHVRLTEPPHALGFGAASRQARAQWLVRFVNERR